MKEMIDDDKITVNVIAQKSSELPNNKFFIGGAFMGNTYDENSETVSAYQVLNPSMLRIFSLDNTGEAGQDIFHELSEAYAGAQLSLQKRTSSSAANEEDSKYLEAHARARFQQSGKVITDTIKSNDFIFKNSGGILKIWWIDRRIYYKTIKGTTLTIETKFSPTPLSK